MALEDIYTIPPVDLEAQDLTPEPIQVSGDDEKKKKVYQEMIRRISKEEGYDDPDLVYAMMGPESGGNPNATSNKDARGLIQVTDATARRMDNGKVKLLQKPGDLYKPEVNLRLGIRYTKFLSNRFNGNKKLIVAGYNAGEGAVEKYGNNVPPYKETENHVKKVNDSYRNITGRGFLDDDGDGIPNSKDPVFNKALQAYRTGQDPVPGAIERPKVKDANFNKFLDAYRSGSGVDSGTGAQPSPTVQGVQTVKSPVSTTGDPALDDTLSSYNGGSQPNPSSGMDEEPIPPEKQQNPNRKTLTLSIGDKTYTMKDGQDADQTKGEAVFTGSDGKDYRFRYNANAQGVRQFMPMDLSLIKQQSKILGAMTRVSKKGEPDDVVSFADGKGVAHQFRIVIDGDGDISYKPLAEIADPRNPGQKIYETYEQPDATGKTIQMKDTDGTVHNFAQEIKGKKVIYHPLDPDMKKVLSNVSQQPSSRLIPRPHTSESGAVTARNSQVPVSNESPTSVPNATAPEPQQNSEPQQAEQVEDVTDDREDINTFIKARADKKTLPGETFEQYKTRKAVDNANNEVALQQSGRLDENGKPAGDYAPWLKYNDMEDSPEARAKYFEAVNYFKRKPMFSPKNTTELLDKGSAGEVSVDLSKKPAGMNASKYLLREAIMNIAPGVDENITVKQIDDWVDRNYNSSKSSKFFAGLDDKTTAEHAKGLISDQGNSNVKVSVALRAINDIMNSQDGVTKTPEVPGSDLVPKIKDSQFGNKEQLNPRLQDWVKNQENLDVSGLERVQARNQNQRAEHEAQSKTQDQIREAVENPGVYGTLKAGITEGVKSGATAAAAVLSPAGWVMLGEDIYSKGKKSYDKLSEITDSDKKAAIQKAIQQQFDTIPKEYGSYQNYQKTKDYTDQMWNDFVSGAVMADPGKALEYPTRILAGGIRGYVNTLISSNLKGLDLVDKLIEAPWAAPDAALSLANPDVAKFVKTIRPSLRTVENGIGYVLASLMGKGDQFKAAMPEDDVSKRLFYNIGDQVEEFMGEDPYVKNHLVYQLAQGLGSAGAFATLGLIAPEASIGEGLREFSLTSAGFGALGQAGQMYSDAKKKGYTETGALLSGAAGLPLGATEGFGVGAALNKTLKVEERRTLSKLIMEFITEGLEEGTQETVQNVGQDNFTKFMESKNPTLLGKMNDIITELPENVAKNILDNGWSAFLTGGIFGTTVKGLGTLGYKGAGIKTDEQIQEEEENHATAPESTPELDQSPISEENPQPVENPVENKKGRRNRISLSDVQEEVEPAPPEIKRNKKERVKLEDVQEEQQPKQDVTPEHQEAIDSVNEWQRKNKSGWSQELMAEAAIVNPKFNEVAEDAESVPAHGMAKSNASQATKDLLNLFQTGVDPSRGRGRLDVAPLAAPKGASNGGATASGTAYRDGSFILVSREGSAKNGITDMNDVVAVLVNPALHDSIASIQKALPNVLVTSYENVKDAIKLAKKNSISTETIKEFVPEFKEAEKTPLSQIGGPDSVMLEYNGSTFPANNKSYRTALKTANQAASLYQRVIDRANKAKEQSQKPTAENMTAVLGHSNGFEGDSKGPKVWDRVVSTYQGYLDKQTKYVSDITQANKNFNQREAEFKAIPLAKGDTVSFKNSAGTEIKGKVYSINGDAVAIQVYKKDGSLMDKPRAINSKNTVITKDATVAANEAATSPTNNKPEPTEAQIEAGNYPKGHINISGLDISIENPKGSTRSGVDSGGKEWTSTLNDHYGYIRGTNGADGEQMDVFTKEGTPADFDGNVFVIHQNDPSTGKFDEHKVMLGYANQREAVAAYKSNYAKGWKGRGKVEIMSVPDFKQWLNKEGRSSEQAKPKNFSPDKIDNNLKAGDQIFRTFQADPTADKLVTVKEVKGDRVYYTDIEGGKTKSALMSEFRPQSKSTGNWQDTNAKGKTKVKPKKKPDKGEGSASLVFNPRNRDMSNFGSFNLAGVGANLSTQARENLETAKAMAEAPGIPAHEIYAKTGWEKGADGKWRYELLNDTDLILPIQDKDSLFKWYRQYLKDTYIDSAAWVAEKIKAVNVLIKGNDLAALLKAIPNIQVRTYGKDSKYNLDQIIDSPKLFEAYPKLKDLTVSFESLPTSIAGNFNLYNGQITINSDLTSSGAVTQTELLDTLHHEIQHWIQRQEDFARGAGSQEFQFIDARKKSLEDTNRYYSDLRTFVEVARDNPSYTGTEVMNIAEQMNERLFTDLSKRASIDILHRMMYNKFNEGFISAELEGYQRQIEANVKDLTELGRIKGNTPSEMYQQTAGEVEARNAGYRVTQLTDIERHQAMPSETEDVGRNHQWVRIGDKIHAISNNEIKLKDVEPNIPASLTDQDLQEMEALKTASFGAVSGAAEVYRSPDGKVVELNKEAQEVIRRIAGIPGSFDGLAIPSSSARKLVGNLLNLAREIKESNPAASNNLYAMAQSIRDAYRSGKNVPIVYLTNADSLDEEKFHKARMVTALTQEVESALAPEQRDIMYNSLPSGTAEQLINQGYPPNPAVIVDEVAAKLGNGQWKELGFATERAGTEWLLDWGLAFNEYNNVQSFEDFKEVSNYLSSVFSELENLINEGATDAKTKTTEQSGQQSNQQGESAANDTGQQEPTTGETIRGIEQDDTGESIPIDQTSEAFDNQTFDQRIADYKQAVDQLWNQGEDRPTAFAQTVFNYVTQDFDPEKIKAKVVTMSLQDAIAEATLERFSEDDLTGVLRDTVDNGTIPPLGFIVAGHRLINSINNRVLQLIDSGATQFEIDAARDRRTEITSYVAELENRAGRIVQSIQTWLKDNPLYRAERALRRANKGQSVKLDAETEADILRKTAEIQELTKKVTALEKQLEDLGKEFGTKSERGKLRERLKKTISQDISNITNFFKNIPASLTGPVRMYSPARASVDYDEAVRESLVNFSTNLLLDRLYDKNDLTPEQFDQALLRLTDGKLIQQELDQFHSEAMLAIQDTFAKPSDQSKTKSRETAQARYPHYKRVKDTIRNLPNVRSMILDESENPTDLTLRRTIGTEGTIYNKYLDAITDAAIYNTDRPSRSLYSKDEISNFIREGDPSIKLGFEDLSRLADAAIKLTNVIEQRYKDEVASKKATMSEEARAEKKQRTQDLRTKRFELDKQIRNIEQKPVGYLRRLDRISVGQAISRWSTAISNQINARGVKNVIGLEDTIDLFLQKNLGMSGDKWSPLKDEQYRDIWKGFFATSIVANVLNRSKINELLSSYPAEAERLIGDISHDHKTSLLSPISLMEKWTDFSLIPSMYFEKKDRTGIAINVLERRLAARGENLGDILKEGDYHKITQQDWNVAIDKARFTTAALSPENKQLNSVINTLANSLPLVANPLKFARVLYNITKFAVERNPAFALSKIAYKGSKYVFENRKGDEADYNKLQKYKIKSADVSKLISGSVMLAIATLMRGAFGDDKDWKNFRIPGTQTYISVERLQPFAGYWFMSKVLSDMSQGKYNMTGKDWAEGLLGINMIPNPFWGLMTESNSMWEPLINTIGTAGAYPWTEKDKSEFSQLVKKFGGSSVGLFMTSLQNWKLLIESMGLDKGMEVDRNRSPFLSEIADRTPFADQFPFPGDVFKDNAVTGGKRTRYSSFGKMVGIEPISPEKLNKEPSKAEVRVDQLNGDPQNKTQTPDEKYKNDLKYQLINARQKGLITQDTFDARVRNYVDQGVIDASDYEKVLEAGETSKLNSSFKNLKSLEDKRDAFKFATELEKQQGLQDLMNEAEAGQLKKNIDEQKAGTKYQTEASIKDAPDSTEKNLALAKGTAFDKAKMKQLAQKFNIDDKTLDFFKKTPVEQNYLFNQMTTEDDKARVMPAMLKSMKNLKPQTATENEMQIRTTVMDYFKNFRNLPQSEQDRLGKIMLNSSKAVDSMFVLPEK